MVKMKKMAMAKSRWCVDCSCDDNNSSPKSKIAKITPADECLQSELDSDWPVSGDSITAKAISHILNRLKQSIKERFSSNGSLSAEKKLAKTILFECILQPCISDGCNVIQKETMRLLGISNSTIDFGLSHIDGKDMNAMDIDLQSGHTVQRKERNDKYDLTIIFDYFHLPGTGPYNNKNPDFCSLIEPDKAQKGKLKNLVYEWKGGVKQLTCQRLQRTAYGYELAADYLDSLTHQQYMDEHPFATLSLETIMQCFCRCNKSKQSINECACPTCTEMECELRALRDVGRFSPKCDDPFCLVFKKTLITTTSWMEFNSCERIPLPSLDRRGSKEPFMMRRYECCLNAREGTVDPCGKCANKMRLPTCACFTRDKFVTWLKKQWTIEGSTHNVIVQRFRDYEGQLKELWESIQSKTKPFMMHLWVRKFNNQSFLIDFDEFDEDTEAAGLFDFASAMDLGSGFVGTCETRGTCNLYVMLACYKIKGETKCDYVRFWSAAKSSGAFHHHALHILVDYLRPLVPNLKRIRIWTDGDGTAYKGFQNFGRMAYWPLDRKVPMNSASENEPTSTYVDDGMVDAEGIEIVHNFFCANHASGVQDSAGKDPRIAMMDAMGTDKASFCDANDCYEWCRDHLIGPKKALSIRRPRCRSNKAMAAEEGDKGKAEEENKVKKVDDEEEEPQLVHSSSSTTQPEALPAVSTGHFFANKYIWHCLAYGELDPHRDKYSMISEARKEYTPIKGTNSFYEFVAVKKEVEGKVVTGIYTRKFPCRCTACRQGTYEECPIYYINGPYKWHDVVLERVFTVSETKEKREKDKGIRKKRQAEKLAEMQPNPSQSGATT